MRKKPLRTIPCVRGEMIQILQGGKFWRTQVPGGWICYASRKGERWAFFFPDPDYEWQPFELEADANTRFSAGDTTLDQELLALDIARENEADEDKPVVSFEKVLEEAAEMLNNQTDEGVE
jgi:hypothetical protein